MAVTDTGRLTVTRRPGERIFVGDDVIVELVEWSRSEMKARIAITAPRDMPILREEIADRPED